MLTEQTISKLLDFQNVPVQKDRGNLQFPHHSTLQKEDRSSGKQAARITRSKVLLIVIAWTTLALTVCAVVGKVGFQLKLPLTFGAIERTNGYLFHIGILALAACVLGLTTWLYSKDKISEFMIVVVIIGAILSVSLPLLTVRSGIATDDAKKPGATFSPPSPATAVVMDTAVIGILYSEDNPTALIGHQVVHEGDAVDGVSIIKVHKDKIEFANNGRRWTQAVGGTPEIYWK
jgi:cell division protein FtsL